MSSSGWATTLLADCKGWHVHAVGGSATDGQVLDSQLDLEVREFRRRLIERCGGVLMLWDTSQLPGLSSLTQGH